MDEIRDKNDREFEESPDVEESPDLDDKAGCPTCGSEDIQSAELLSAWKEIEELQVKLSIAEANLTVKLTPLGPGKNPPELRKPVMDTDIDWKYRYDKIKAGYVKTRLEVSGSFGNWDYATRKRVLEHEISTELGFVV